MNIVERIFSKRINQSVAQAVSNIIANRYNAAVFNWLNDGQTIINPDNYNYVKAWENTGAIYECISLITSKIIASPRIVYKIKDQEGYKKYKALSNSPNHFERVHATKMRSSVLEEVKVPAIDKLLKNPNPRQNGDEFIEMLAGCFLIRGNSYVYGNAGSEKAIKDQKWTELFAMPADMHIESGGVFEPVKKYFLNWGTPAEEYFPANQIKHIRSFNPNYSITGSQMYGVSPLRPYLYSISKIKHGNIQSDKQLKNGGKMGFIAPKNKEDELGDEQKGGLSETIKRAHSSTEALDRLIPSSVPLDWTEIGLSSADLQLLEATGAAADDIYRGYHVPLYFRTLESSTYNNVTTAKKQLIYDAVAPLADRISAALTEFICKPYLLDGYEYVIVLDYMSLPELSDDVKAIAEFLEKAWYLTPNQKLEVLGFGRSTAAGMDEIFINRNMVRLEDVMAGKINNTSQGQTDNSSQEDPSFSQQS